MNSDGICGSTTTLGSNTTTVSIDFLPNDITPYLAQDRWTINLKFIYGLNNIESRTYKLSDYELRAVFYEMFNACKLLKFFDLLKIKRSELLFLKKL